MRIVQIAPHVGPGTGVGAVAYHLEQEWLAAGHEVSRFTIKEARGEWIPTTLPGTAGKVALAARVVWFSTVGSLLARRFLANLPSGTVSVCHNDVLAGDVYVNHGNLIAAMRARGHAWFRLLRNPLHLFTTARDVIRYGIGVHRAVVNLSMTEDALLRATFRVAMPTWVIPNGVDLEMYRPPTDDERRAARRALGLDSREHLVLFVGHEFRRKGLFPLLEAMLRLPPEYHLLVIGGDANELDRLRRDERVRRLADRCHLLGPKDPGVSYWAADVLVQASAYESHGLVVTEALASSLPVISTPVGCASDVIAPGSNGYLTGSSPPQIAASIEDVMSLPVGSRRRAARASVQDLSWTEVSRMYLSRLQLLAEEPRA